MQLKGSKLATNTINTHKSVKYRTPVGTIFLHRERHFRQRKIRGCPRKLFAYEQIKFVTKIRSVGNKIILAAEINENEVEYNLSRVLQQIGLTEDFYRRFKTSFLASYDRGSI